MRSNSLKEKLHNMTRSRGYSTLDEVHAAAVSMNRKVSYAERLMRPSESPEIETMYNEKGFVTGYKWIGETVFKSSADEMRVFLPENEVADLQRKYPALYPEKKQVADEVRQTSLL